MRLVLYLTTGLCAIASAQQHSTTAIANPFTSPEDRVQGAATFRSQCASCHGFDARGGSGGPDLTRGQYKHAVSDDAMYRVITKGVPGTAMPGFAVQAKAAWQLVTFVRSLNRGAAVGSSSVQRGAQLFAGLKCAGCHSSGAPDLRVAAARLSREELRQALIAPEADVAPEYWQWRWKLRNGSVVEGRRLNEDTYSVQIVDADGRLRSLERQLIATTEHQKKSKMPSFANQLSAEDLDSVVAYMVSLRETN